MAEERAYDLVVVGAGPGGYAAALRAAELGMKTACVDREELPGGTCLRVGCIPSKVLLDSSEHYYFASKGLGEHGVRVGEVRLDLPALMARKQRVVEELARNVKILLDRRGVDIVTGAATLDGPGRVLVRTGPGAETRALGARRVLLAAGSEPLDLPSVPVDGEAVVDSTGALAFGEVPKHLAVVGGGYIGLELGSVWARLGAEVTVVEALPRIAAQLDGQVGRALERSLRGQGISFRTRTRVVESSATARGAKLTLETEGEKGRQTLAVDRVLVAVGRRPATRDLGLESAEVKTDPRSGRVWVDARYRTTAPGVYAIGDLIDGPMLAHKATAEGIAAAEAMAGLPREVNYDAIPSAIYTHPEVASVGWTEEQLTGRGIPFRAGIYPFSGAARGRCAGETEGFAKVLAHARTGRLLGAHIIGPRASDLIAEAVLAVELGASAEALARTIHGHPTFGEALREAAEAARDRSDGSDRSDRSQRSVPPVLARL